MGALQHFEGLSDSWPGPECSQSPGEETSSEGHRQRSSFAVLHTVESHTEHHLEKTGVVCENADAKLICIFSPCTHTHFYLSWDSVAWSLPLWAGTGLDRSSQNVPFRVGAMSTPYEPSGASGQHPPYPTEMGLFLWKQIHIIQKHTATGEVWALIEAAMSALCPIICAKISLY